MQRSDELPTLSGEGRGERMADALTSICLDSLTGGSEGRDVTIAEVFVDAALAATSFGEAGVTQSSGLRAGPNTLSGFSAPVTCGSYSRAGTVVLSVRPTYPRQSHPAPGVTSGCETKASAPSLAAAAAIGCNPTTSTRDLEAGTTIPTISHSFVGFIITSPSTASP
jgi:hypothetical protein